ncbi:MAG: GNAT family N-acetyltransferase, partial [Chloroflexota bacterium]
AQEGAAALAASVVGWARSQGLPGLEAFRGGPGFLPFGTQLSTHWPHLYAPLRAAGFRQPRDLLAYCGETAPDALPEPGAPPDGLEFRARRGRLEAWWQGEPVGVCVATPLGAGAGLGGGRGRKGWEFADPRLGEWAMIRRLVVEREARGCGIGSALFAEQLRRLHARRYTGYLLHIPDDPEDQPAQWLYGKFGRLVDRQQVLRVSF